MEVKNFYNYLNVWEQRLRVGKKTILVLSDQDQSYFSEPYRTKVRQSSLAIAACIDTLYQYVIELQDEVLELMEPCDIPVSNED